jgi:hypothetical protein
LLLSSWLVACGGEIEAEKPAPIVVPLGPASPDFLPTGMYTANVIEASCNVNDAFRVTNPMLIVRGGNGANVPLPFRFGSADSVSFSAPRQDWDLTSRSTKKWTMKNENVCPEGEILVSLTMTALDVDSVRFDYREQPIDCGLPTCTVDFEFSLTQRACPATDSAECVPGTTEMPLGENATQRVDCTCATGP